MTPPRSTCIMLRKGQGRERTDWFSLVKALSCYSGVDPAFGQQVLRVPQA